MTEAQAKRQLRQMLRTLTPGSVLHLLSELFAEQANQAQRDEQARRQSHSRSG
jgi:hypothetical protein